MITDKNNRYIATSQGSQRFKTIDTMDYNYVMFQHPIYVDVYAFSSTITTVDPFSYFRTPFKLPKSENNYVDFFKDVTLSSLSDQLVGVFPKELHFGFVKHSKTMVFDVFNNSDSLLCVNWIHLTCGKYTIEIYIG